MQLRKLKWAIVFLAVTTSAFTIGCQSEPEVIEGTVEVEVTREVEVIREVPVEVTKEV